MIPIQNFYTGSNAGIILPDSNKTDRSLKDFYEQRREENTQNLANAQRKQDQMLEYTSVEPIQALADQHQALQATWISDFENKAKSVNPQTANYSQLMDLKKAKNELIMKQQNLKANQDLYMQDAQKRASEAWKYPYFKDAEQKFLQDPNAQWDRNLAMYTAPAPIKESIDKIVKGMDLPTGTEKSGNYYDNPLTGERKYDNEKKIVLNKNGEPATVDEIKAMVKERVKGSEQETANAIKHFDLLMRDPKTIDIAKSYLENAEDTNGDGTIDNSERENAIINYYVDNGDYDTLVSSRKSDVGVKESGDWMFINGGWGTKKDGVAIKYNPNMKTAMVGGGEGFEFTAGALKPIQVPASELKLNNSNINFPADALVWVIPNKYANGKVEGILDITKNEDVEVTTKDALATPDNYTINTDPVTGEKSYTFRMKIPSNVAASMDAEVAKIQIDGQTGDGFTQNLNKYFNKPKEAPAKTATTDWSKYKRK